MSNYHYDEAKENSFLFARIMDSVDSKQAKISRSDKINLVKIENGEFDESEVSEILLSIAKKIGS